MINRTKSLIVSAGAVGAGLVGALIISALLQPTMPGLEGVDLTTVKPGQWKKLVIKCADCHNPHTKISGLMNTLSGGMMSKHLRDGVRHWDMTEQPKTLTYWSKLERSLEKNTMPPVSYTVVHWGSALTPQERVIYLKTAKAEIAKMTQGQPLVSAIPQKVKYNEAKAALGEYLYNSVKLSDDDTVSCATCHDLAKGGTDNLQYSTGVREQKGGVNAPTTFNATFNFIQFWDGRAKDLQAQAGGPPLNPVEMGYSKPEDWKEISEKLAQDADFLAQFVRSYPNGLNAENITDAIAHYEHTLITPNDAFDKFLAGDTHSINQDAKLGYALFTEFGCTTCHNGPGLGGNSFEAIDLKGDYFAARLARDPRAVMTDGDNGRYSFTKKLRDLYKVKVPLLRNIALTAPYMHDGTISTMEEAVHSMMVHQSGVAEPRAKEVDKIVAFLKTLTGDQPKANILYQK